MADALAYDVTFIFNTNGTGPNLERRLSVGGKISDISKSDLLDFAKQNDIKNATAIINRVAEAIGKFNEFADRYDISQPWRSIIQKTLNDNLVAFDYMDRNEEIEAIIDKYGRTITDFSITVNSKGHYQISAIINDQRHRRFVRYNMKLHSDLSNRDIYNLPADERIRLVEMLFPPE